MSGEESGYTNAVPEYQKKSRFPILGRYRDLIVFVKAAFSDDRITEIELNQIERIERDILLEYQTAADILFRMDKNAPQYSAALRLLEHLHRCNVFMQFAYKVARDKYGSGAIETPQRDKVREMIPLDAEEDKVIQVSLDSAGYKLLKDLDTPQKRIEAELPHIRRNLARLSVEERIELEAKINAMVEQMKDRQLEQLSIYELNHLIGLEKYLHEGEQRIRGS